MFKLRIEWGYNLREDSFTFTLHSHNEMIGLFQIVLTNKMNINK
jgi:hypothetical protein